jgi:hypothetical protein
MVAYGGRSEAISKITRGNGDRFDAELDLAQKLFFLVRCSVIFVLVF